MISPQRRREIIDALRRGTVPQRGLDAFAVGTDRFAAAFDDELATAAAGVPASRRDVAAIEDLTVTLDPATTMQQLHQAVSDATEKSIDLTPWVTAEAAEGLKFSECLPHSLATEVITRRLADPESTARARGERLAIWRDAS